VDLATPITWATVARIGLLWGAEYGMLALIEDAPASVKIATIICALGALATLESREWLRQKRQGLFLSVLCGLGIIYLGFLGYAVFHSMERIWARDGLEKIYVASGKLIERDLPIAASSTLFEELAVRDFSNDVSNWEKTSSAWIARHLGETGRDRFTDPSGFPSFTWDHATPEFNTAMNRLTRDRKNLSIMIESGSYYGN
jgi:hypothetical protein